MAGNTCSGRYNRAFVKVSVTLQFLGTIALSYPPRVRVRATVKLSAAFFHDESSITIGGYESAIALIFVASRWTVFLWFFKTVISKL